MSAGRQNNSSVAACLTPYAAGDPQGGNGASPIPGADSPNAPDISTLRELIAFHQNIAASVENLDDPQIGEVARRIKATHLRFIDTLTMLLSFLE